MSDHGFPFLKWPGGKRWAAETVCQVVRAHLSKDGRYLEPFLGSGAVFFRLRPTRAILSDINEDLIEVYRTVKADPRSVAQRLRAVPVNRERYYQYRTQVPRTAIGRAVRFLYLNRTAFSGMYRVNRDGKFNVPFGGGERTPKVLYATSLLDDAALALKSARLLHGDFTKVLKLADEGDVVYCDPTYTVAHNNNGFVRYNERNFSWKDQGRLADEAKKAVQRGATVIVSNAYHRAIFGLYAGWKAVVLKRFSTVSPDARDRRLTSEYLFVSCPHENCECLRRR